MNRAMCPCGPWVFLRTTCLARGSGAGSTGCAAGLVRQATENRLPKRARPGIPAQGRRAVPGRRGLRPGGGPGSPPKPGGTGPLGDDAAPQELASPSQAPGEGAACPPFATSAGPRWCWPDPSGDPHQVGAPTKWACRSCGTAPRANAAARWAWRPPIGSGNRRLVTSVTRARPWLELRVSGRSYWRLMPSRQGPGPDVRPARPAAVSADETRHCQEAGARPGPDGVSSPSHGAGPPAERRRVSAGIGPRVGQTQPRLGPSQLSGYTGGGPRAGRVCRPGMPMPIRMTGEPPWVRGGAPGGDDHPGPFRGIPVGAGFSTTGGCPRPCRACGWGSCPSSGDVARVPRRFRPATLPGQGDLVG